MGQRIGNRRIDVLHAVLGNVGTLIAFRVGPEDAGLVAQQLQPTFDALDLINLLNHRFYTRLMIDDTPSKPFSAESISSPIFGHATTFPV